jgi:hypothetical protein
MRLIVDIAFFLSAGLCIAAIAILLTSAKRAGIHWLLGFLVLTLVSQFGFYVPNLLLRSGVLDPIRFREINEPLSVVFQFLRVAAWASLLGFVFALKSWLGSPGKGVGATEARHLSPALPDGPVHPPDALYGVHGWLKFIVIGNLYLAPVLVGLQLIMAWVGFVMLAERHPGILLVGFAATAVDGVLIYMGIDAARALRDLRSRAVQQMRRLLLLRLGWTLLGAPLMLAGWALSGLDPQALMPDIVKSLVLGVVGFAVGWTYFKLSKRVKATYPDWNASPA